MNRQEAIDIVKKNWPDSSFTSLKEALEFLIPELMNTDDEKIKEAIIKGITHAAEEGCFCADNYSVKECVAWIEKQCENNIGISEATKQKLKDNLNKALEKETPESWNEFLKNQGEQKPADVRTTGYWHVEDIEQKPAWSEEDERVVESILKYYRYMREEWVNWLKSLKERVGCEVNCTTKKEWSEEDNDNLTNILVAIDNMHESSTAKELKCWLKSLRPQKQWKPSDEQIKVCKEVYADILSAKGFDLGTVNSELNRLEEELKKLREE